jgi:hypothetical protein
MLPKCLGDNEIQRLLALPDTADPFGLRDRTILELFYATGVRRTEMTRLDHGDFDPSARTLLVRKGKAGKSRLLPVGERAAWWLERYLIESRPLFAHIPAETALFLSGYGTRFSPAYIGNWVAGLMKKAGVKIPGSSHLWRHSCATGMLEGGADICYIQEPSSEIDWSAATARRVRAAASIKCSATSNSPPPRFIPTSASRRSPKSTPAATLTRGCRCLTKSPANLRCKPTSSQTTMRRTKNFPLPTRPPIRYQPFKR